MRVKYHIALTAHEEILLSLVLRVYFLEQGFAELFSAQSNCW